MASLKESAEQFLQLKTIAVAGVSSTKKDAANYREPLLIHFFQKTKKMNELPASSADGQGVFFLNSQSYLKKI